MELAKRTRFLRDEVIAEELVGEAEGSGGPDGGAGRVERLLDTIGEAAALTGYAAAYFRKLIAKGRLRAKKRGRDWFLDKAEVLAYAEAMREPGCDKTNPWRPAYNSHAD